MKSVIEEKVGQQVSWVDSHKNPVEAFKQAEADNAALVEMLAQVYCCALSQGGNLPSFPKGDDTEEGDEETMSPDILGLLAQPHPGWPLVDRLNRLKKIAEAARPLLDMDLRQDVKAYQERLFALGKAFADLDGLSEVNGK